MCILLYRPALHSALSSVTLWYMYAVCAKCMQSACCLQTACLEIQNAERQKGSRATEAFISAPLG